MKNIKLINILFISAVMLVAAPAYAAKDALAKAQYMLRQMNAELNQLRVGKQKVQAEKSQLESDNKALQKKYDKLTKKTAKNKTAMKGRLSELKETYKDEIKSHNATRKQLKMVTNEKVRLFDIATEQTQKIDLCMANNNKLFAIDKELLVRFEQKGVWDSMVQAEPFSKLSQVEIENLVDDYQYNMENLRVEVGM